MVSLLISMALAALQPMVSRLNNLPVPSQTVLPSPVPSLMVLTSPVLTLPTLSTATNFTVTNAGALTTAGSIADNGGSLTTTTAGTANLFNTNATTLNIGGAATTLNIGGTSGTATINNATLSLPNATAINATGATANFSALTTGGGYGSTGTTLDNTGDIQAQGALTIQGTSDLNGDITSNGNLTLNGGSITTSAGTANLFNSNATTLNIGGAATAVNIGAGTGTTTLNNNLAVNLVDNTSNALAIADGSYNFININTSTGANNISFGNTSTHPTYSFLGTGAATFSGDINANSGTIATNQTTGNLFNTNATTLNIGGAATTLALGASTGTATINNATLSLPNALVGIGVSPISALEVSHPLGLGATGKAAAIFNQTENEDILTASASGTTEFTVAANGNLTTRW